MNKRVQGLTAEEIRVIAMSGLLWNEFVKLGDHPPSDLRGAEREIQNFQNRIMARAVIRDHVGVLHQWNGIE